MTKLRNYLKSLIQGENTLTSQTSFALLLKTILAIYLTYSIVFFFYGPICLSIISFVCIIFAYINLRLFLTNRTVLSFILSDFVILVYAVLTTLFLGADYGFSLYALALIPLVYAISFNLKKSGRFVLNPTPLAVASCFVFAFCKLLQIFPPMKLPILNSYFIIIIYYTNTIIVLIIIIEICKIFSKEASKRQTTLENENMQLDFYANQDSLTKLQNRRYIELKLKESILKAKNETYHFSILMCDIDDFKKINDTYGHISGDLVLKNISSLIKGTIRDFDFAARWGGEEFIILIKGSIPIASLIAERINKSVANAIVKTDNGDIHYTITIGISEYKPGITCRELVDQADENLYIGKRSGKDCVVC